MSARLRLDHQAKTGGWLIRTSTTGKYADYVRGNVEVRTEFDRRGVLVWIARYVDSTVSEAYQRADRGKLATALAWLSDAQPARVTVSLKVAPNGLSLNGADLYEVWLPGFRCGHVGAHGTKWRRYSWRTGRMAGDYFDTPQEAAEALAAGWGDNENADIVIVEHSPEREQPTSEPETSEETDR